MYSRFTIHTRLSAAEAERVLERLVRPKGPFVGQVADGSFTFHRVISGRNSFRPIVIGRVTEGEGGAVIRGHMRLAMAVAVVMTVWMAATTTAAFKALPTQIAASNLMAACGFAFLPLFGVILIAVGYYPEKRKAMGLLVEAFEQSLL